MLSFYLLTFAASVQAYNQFLPGSCNFESNTCGYTSDAEFTSWTLHKDGRFVAVDAAASSDDQSDKTAAGADSGQQMQITGVLLSPSLEHSE
uniref:thyroid hormone-induced protein B-like n=1 Tax=Monopterus albus TaxID=43700 RepID=UPI0009B3D220|nr:thyroid hormone-induced protein B-like [Monopterus albus]